MNPAESLPFGVGALVAVGFYVVFLLGIGAFAYSKTQKNNFGDFYLAGRNMGLPVLFLTLYATQYSGNTFLGFSGAAYREGFSFLVSVHFMIAIVIAYLILAPRLFRLSRKHSFVTPGDYIFHRYQNHALRIIITLFMTIAACNFLLAQMKTLGTAFAGISQGQIPMWAGVVGLAAIMLIYESLGGMRSVAWTDALQGSLLLAGFIALIFIAFSEIGDLQGAVATLAANPETLKKLQPPEGEGLWRWLSFIFMVGLGGAIYPQAIQRIYSARNGVTLKRSLAFMAVAPLTTALIAVVVGVLMAAHSPGLENVVQEGTSKAISPSETVLPLLCLKIMQSSEWGYWLVVMIFASLLAAVMSTADSALLTVSSMVSKDIYGAYIRPNADQTQLTRMGKWISWGLMAPVVWMALSYEGNLIHLLKIKFELLIQCVPAFYLGLHWERLRARTVLCGIAAGLVVTLGLIWSGSLGLASANHPLWGGVHAGIWGLGVNLLICGSDFFRQKAPAER
ncbi:MAG: sodium:solute symporter family protein [Candidatus Nitrohelix vancouverensis]|uniref:Sodium:solute symporter family protein n=1 Tax=Candidatus Nitrohelix vancouverensis TaxID=2705534 RepID=A0A7T0C1G5_9BACT|nr:MAG: sodium:solute symporter family protein [Candidatus Nitrohelix vancouverensis]